MKFTSYATDREIEELNLIQDGKYQGIVIEASDEKKDKNGNDMIKLKLNITDMNDRIRTVNDSLLSAFPLKLKHFCDSTDMSEQYKKGEISTRECVGKKVIVSIVTSKPDSEGKKWTRVDDYLPIKLLETDVFKDSELPDLFA